MVELRILKSSKRLLDVDAAARYLDVPRRTIYKWTSSRSVPFVKLGRHLKFDQRDLDRMIEEKKVQPVPKVSEE